MLYKIIHSTPWQTCLPLKSSKHLPSNFVCHYPLTLKREGPITVNLTGEEHTGTHIQTVSVSNFNTIDNGKQLLVQSRMQYTFESFQMFVYQIEYFIYLKKKMSYAVHYQWVNSFASMLEKIICRREPSLKNDCTSRLKGKIMKCSSEHSTENQDFFSVVNLGQCGYKTT